MLREKLKLILDESVVISAFRSTLTLRVKDWYSQIWRTLTDTWKRTPAQRPFCSNFELRAKFLFCGIYITTSINRRKHRSCDNYSIACVEFVCAGLMVDKKPTKEITKSLTKNSTEKS
jgi:hypothetical protein